MLRLAFVSILILIGTYFTLQMPFYGLLFYLGNAYFRPEEWVYGDAVRSLHLSLIIGFYLLISSLLSKERFVSNGRVGLIALFVLQSLFSTAMSDHADYCWPYVLEFIRVVLITYLIVVLTTDFEKFRLVILVIVLALGLEQAKQGWFYLITSPGGPNQNTSPFLGDNNGIAQGMLMLLPLIGFLGQTSGSKWRKLIFRGLFVGCLYRALSTYSRGGFLGAIGMGLAWWLRSFHKLRIAVGIVLTLLVVVPALPDAFWNRIHTISTYGQDLDTSAAGRLHFWDVALGMAAANPLLGVGFNGYNKAYDSFDTSDGTFGRQRSVHSTYLGVLAELGYPGLVLFVTILGCSFTACGQVRKLASRNEVPIELGNAAVALESSLIAFVITGAFLPSQYSEMTWHFIGLSVALRQIAVQKLAAQPVFAAAYEPIAT
jgi:probable O-glycosylation ligase (exosortase A-associated)